MRCSLPSCSSPWSPHRSKVFGPASEPVSPGRNKSSLAGGSSSSHARRLLLSLAIYGPLTPEAPLWSVYLFVDSSSFAFKSAFTVPVAARHHKSSTRIFSCRKSSCSRQQSLAELHHPGLTCHTALCNILVARWRQLDCFYRQIL